MLLINSDNIINFNLKVTGSDQIPTVRVLLHLDPIVVYVAQPATEHTWTVNMKLGDVKHGTYPFSVEVVVGGRIFTPLRDKLAVGEIEVAVGGFPIVQTMVQVGDLDFKQPEITIQSDFTL